MLTDFFFFADEKVFTDQVGNLGKPKSLYSAPISNVLPKEHLFLWSTDFNNHKVSEKVENVYLCYVGNLEVLNFPVFAS